MENLDDLTNSNLLGDEFSNAGGFGRFFEKVKEKAQSDWHKAGDVINKAENKAKEKAKSDLGKLKDFAKKEREKIKKVVRKLKDMAGKIGKKFRNRFRAIMRKAILFNISHNIHGFATRLYPVVNPDANKNKIYKATYLGKADKVYKELQAKWQTLGGDKNDLDDAIRKGGEKKQFLKLPYKSATGSDADELYGYYMPADDFSEITNESLLNADGNYSYLTNESLLSAEGDAEAKTGDTPPADASTAPADANAPVEEVPAEEEKKKGIKGFFAWFKRLFHKHKAEENPYNAGTPEAVAHETEEKADAPNLPADSEADNDVLKAVTDTAKVDDAGGKTDVFKKAETKMSTAKLNGDEPLESNKIFGISKPVFYTGVGILALVGGWLIFRKK